MNSMAFVRSSGAALSSSSGYTGGGLATPTGIAVDGAGNLWVANNKSGSYNVSEFNNSGTAISSSTVLQLAER